MRYLVIALIRLYQQHIRQLHNRECIYDPTCSEYAVICIKKYGLVQGAKYAALRIKRCNGALYQGGEDYP